jgi:hypothetical protein
MKRATNVALDSRRLAQYAQPVSCYICEEDNGFDWARCRNCHSPLSLSHSRQRRRDVQVITALGSPQCGKTSYLGVLLELLTRPGRGLQLRVCNSESLTLQESVMLGFCRGRFPESTPSAPEKWNWAHCELKAGKRCPTDVAVPDFPAAALSREWERPGRVGTIRDTLSQSSGVLLMLDAARLASGEREEEFAALKAISYLCELDGHKKRGWPGRPVAIVLTKSDSVSESETFIADVAPRLWDLCQDRLNCTKVFRSSLAPYVMPVDDGCEIVSSPLRLEPKGIMEPFEWVMQRLL